MIKLSKNQKGFTLIELLIGIAIMTIIMAGVFGVLSGSIRSYQLSQKRTHEVQQSRAAINAIIDDLRNATAITTPAKGDTQNSINYTANAANVTIAVGTGQNTGRLMRDATAVTTNIVSGVSFARDATDGRIVQVTITLFSPDNQSSGNFVMNTVVFATNLAP